jgi:hypothetical protein
VLDGLADRVVDKILLTQRTPADVPAPDQADKFEWEPGELTVEPPDQTDQAAFDAKVAAAHALAQAALTSGLKLQDGTPVSPAALATAVFPSDAEKESITKTGHVDEALGW